MSLAKTLAIALAISASTSSASKAIKTFSDDAKKNLQAVKEAATWNNWGDKNMRRGLAMVAPIALAVKEAATLEDKIADVAKVANVDFGSKAFIGLQDSAIRVSNTLGVASTDVAELMAELAAGGVPIKRLESIAIMAGKVGLAFDVTAGEAGKAFMTIQNAMALTEAETKTVMDAMNAATNKYGGKAAELLNFMAQGGASVAKTLKISGTEMQAFGNAMQVVGVSSSEAATTMERFQQAVLMKKPLAKIFQEVGGGAKGLIAILEKANKSGNATQWLIKQGVGQYSTKIAQMAMNMGTEKGLKAQLSYLSDKQNVEGSSDREAENRMRTTSSQLGILKTQAVNAGIMIGSKLLPVLVDLGNQAKPIVKSISDWIGKNPELTATLIKAFAALAIGRIALGGIQKTIGTTIKTFQGLKTAFGILKFGAGAFKRFYLAVKLASQLNSFARGGSIISKVLSSLKTGFLSVGKAIMIAGRFLLANPIILIITAIAVAVFLIIKNWDKIKPWIVKLWNWVTTKTKAAWNAIKTFFIELWSKVKAIFQKTWEWIKQLFLDYHPIGLVISHWDKISGFFKNLWDGVKETFKKAIDWIVAKFQWLNDNVLKPMGNFLGIGSGGDVNVNHGRQPTPQPVPLRAGNNNSITYNPVIHINGNADQRTAQMLSAQMRRDFARQMQDYKHQQDRSNVG